MFWKFHLDTSGIDTLLAKQDVTLTEILDEEEVLQECKTQNDKLIDFLTRDDVLKELLHLIVDPPSDDVAETLKYKYSNLACEVITLDIDTILEKIVSDTENLDIIWSFTETPPPLNPLIASFFSKVITMLVCRKSSDTFEYLKNHDAVNKLIVHIEISAIMELFIKMLTVVESQEIKIEVSRWLNEENLIEKLITLLHPSQQDEKHYNVSQLLSELVRIGRDSISQYIQTEEDPLLLSLEKKETVEQLLNVMFENPDHVNASSSVVHGILALSSMMETRRPVVEGMEELITPMDVERIVQGVHNTLEVVATRLQDFHDMLLRSHSEYPMETTFGVLDPPLGRVRLSIAGLISTAVLTNTQVINFALAETGTMAVLMDLLSRYEWNNFLHSFVLQCIFAVLNSESLQVGSKETIESADPLIKHLFGDCNIIQRCLHLWQANEISEKSGSHRKGYMGHLTKIINEIIHSKDKGPNHEIITCLFNELSDEVREQWNDLINGSLQEINKKNLCTPVTTFASAFDSSDSDNEEYHPITMSQYEGTLQQAFENYQVQPMTNEFIESFGYDEESVQSNENLKNPFDEVGNINFSINANEESENEKLFESVCEQKIQPFDDSDESDDEDVWDEKQFTFSSTPHITNSNSQISRQSKTTAGDSSDEEASPDDVTDQLPVKHFDDVTVVKTKEPEDKMEVDAEWTANFDIVNVQTTDGGASNWANVTLTTTKTEDPTKTEDSTSLSSSGEAFADFTDISKFENTNDLPVAMETEGLTKPSIASIYEVKMEEDNPSNPVERAIEKNDHLDEDLSSKSELTLDLNPSATTLNVSPSSTAKKLTSITVKSIRSPSKAEADKQDASSKSSTESEDQPSEISDVSKLTNEEQEKVCDVAHSISENMKPLQVYENMNCEEVDTHKITEEINRKNMEKNQSSLTRVEPATNGPVPDQPTVEGGSQPVT